MTYQQHPTPPAQNQPIIFFDGACVLCNGFIDRVYHVDKRKQLSFAPLQGKTAGALLPQGERGKNNLSTILYWREGQILSESDAVLQIAKDLGGIHTSLYYLTKWIPKLLRDAVYRLVAKNRYNLFGKQDTCRLPNHDHRILD